MFYKIFVLLHRYWGIILTYFIRDACNFHFSLSKINFWPLKIWIKHKLVGLVKKREFAFSASLHVCHFHPFFPQLLKCTKPILPAHLSPATLNQHFHTKCFLWAWSYHRWTERAVFWWFSAAGDRCSNGSSGAQLT